MKRLSLLLTSALLTLTAEARYLSQEEITTAATTALETPLLQRALPNTTLTTVDALDGLWCVHLDPSGYLLFSGSTHTSPLLAFSSGHPSTDATEVAIIADLRAQIHAAEATPPDPTIENAWTRLLNPPRVTTFATAYTKQVGPLLSTSWVQCSPWNDFSPQMTPESSATTDDNYRGRAPIGCVATAYAQLMNYHQWPVYVEGPIQQSHDVKEGALGTTATYDFCFNGDLPLDWSAMQNTYTWNATTESKRFPIARLALFTDILAEMTFKPDGSSTALATPCYNPWYTFGAYSSKTRATDFTEAQLAAIKNSLDNGLPIPTEITGHAIVIDGYAEADAGTYLCVKYGSLPDKDTFYLGNALRYLSWVTNHAPRLQLQATPLPRKIKSGHPLTWHLPWFHKNTFTGFTLTATPYTDATLTTWREPATAITDCDANTTYYSLNDFCYYNGQYYEAIKVSNKPVTYGAYTYTLAEPFVPTANSKLSFLANAYKSTYLHLQLQLWSEANPQWTTLYTFASSTNNTWQTPSIDLSPYAGTFCRLRLSFHRSTGTVDNNGFYQIADLNVTNVQSKGTPLTWTVDGSTRTMPLIGLTEGAHYAISITPTLTTGTCNSALAFTTLSTTTPPPPTINTLTRDGLYPLKEGILAEARLNGATAFTVTCASTTTTLTAISSCPTLLPDSAINIATNDEGTFTLTLDPKITNAALDGSRLILTLRAQDANGLITTRDIPLALRQQLETLTFPTGLTQKTQAWLCAHAYANAITSGTLTCAEGTSATTLERAQTLGLTPILTTTETGATLAAQSTFKITDLTLGVDTLTLEVTLTATAGSLTDPLTLDGTLQLLGANTLDGPWEPLTLTHLTTTRHSATQATFTLTAPRRHTFLKACVN